MYVTCIACYEARPNDLTIWGIVSSLNGYGCPYVLVNVIQFVLDCSVLMLSRQDLVRVFSSVFMFEMLG